MIHVLVFLRRASSWTEEDFFSHWRGDYKDRMSTFPEILGYVQCKRKPTLEKAPNPAQENGGFDGVDEFWLANQQAWEELKLKPTFKKNILNDLYRFTEPEQSMSLITNDHTLIKASIAEEPASKIKLMYVIKRKDGMTREAFRDYYKNKHTRFSNELPGQQSYVQCHVVDPLPGAPEPPFDGVSQIWLKDVTALQTLQSSPQLQKGVEDCSRFLDMKQFFSFIGSEERFLGARYR